MTHTRPVRAEISRGHLLHNYRHLRGLAGAETELLAVVKANAYGHGLSGCAQILAGGGCRWFGVTCVEEGVALRPNCPSARILIMSGVWQQEADSAVEHRLTPVVWEPAHLDWLQTAAQQRGVAAGQLAVHVEIDTGMSRQGVAPDQLPWLLDRFGPGSPLRLEAVMTHFHSPDHEAVTTEQERLFGHAVEAVVARGLRPEFLSAGSSAAALQPNGSAVTTLARRIGARRLIRPGIALYGYAPGADNGTQLQPVLSWKTRVVSLRDIQPGSVVGYDGTFVARRTTRLALLPLGYADGLNRLLSNRGSALVRGRRAPIAGRISMDHTVLDVTDIPCIDQGDEVVLIGTQQAERITAADMAAAIGTIPYEVLCTLAARVPRIGVD